MKARLICRTGTLAGTGCEFDEEVTIGKSGDCNLRLDPPIVSGRHARIYLDAETRAYYLEDLGSRNGTELDGMRVTGHRRLDSLHVITFAGKFDFLFYAPRESSPRSAAADAERTPPEPRAETRAEAPAGPKPAPQPQGEATVVENPEQPQPPPARPAAPTAPGDGEADADDGATRFDGPPPGPEPGKRTRPEHPNLTLPEQPDAANRTMPERPGAEDPDRK